MSEQQKDALALAQPNASLNSSTAIIQQNAVVAQPKSGTKRKNNSKARKPLSTQTNVYSLVVKCYNEQLSQGFDKTKEMIQRIDKSKLQVLCICHDRDEYSNGPWVSCLEKVHYHIIVRCTNRKDRMRVGTILNMLGVYFRPGLDDSLWDERGVETVGNFAGYATYLTHETEEAIHDGKELYDVSELVSNLTLDEIEQVRAGYVRVSNSRKVTTKELEALDHDAFELGYNLKDFISWYGSQPFSVRSNAKMKTIRESYDRGVDSRILEDEQIARLCIFIEGAPNTGKSYATKKALAGHKYLSVGGGGTGKFDKLRPDHDAIIIDDDVCPNLLNMADDYICRAYKRGSNNPAWTGHYFIVTSNLSFHEWLASCGINTYQGYYGRPSEHYKAMLSRFAVGRICKSSAGFNQLYFECAPERGDLFQKKIMLEDFQKKFNDVIATYTPNDVQFDYGSIITNFKSYGMSSGILF